MRRKERGKKKNFPLVSHKKTRGGREEGGKLSFPTPSKLTHWGIKKSFKIEIEFVISDSGKKTSSTAAQIPSIYTTLYYALFYTGEARCRQIVPLFMQSDFLEEEEEGLRPTLKKTRYSAASEMVRVSPTIRAILSHLRQYGFYFFALWELKRPLRS